MDISIETFYQTNIVDSNFDEKHYLIKYPYVKDFYQPYCRNNGIDDKHRLFYHWHFYGDKIGSTPKKSNSKTILETNGSLFQTAGKVIYLKPTHGLANRLFNINSFVVFARQYNFDKIKICWVSSDGFSGETFESLFNTENLSKFNIEFITEQEYSDACEQYLVLDELVSQHKYLLQYEYELPPHKIINYITNNSFCYCWFAAIHYMFSDVIAVNDDFIRSLEPSDMIKDRLKQYNVPKNSIGVHIRRGDALTAPYAYEYHKSTPQSFINLINQLDNKDIVLATDCKATEDRVIKNCTTKNIIIYNKTFIDNNITESDNKPNQIDAVAEVFLLSETDKVYGSNFSTFSMLAAQIKSKPFETVKLSQFIHVNDYYLPSLSLMVGVKNRFKPLQIAISSWINQKAIKDIVIIDWDSDDLNKDYLESLDPRIRVIRYDNKPTFALAEVLNKGIEHTKYDHILKMDVDYIINPYYQLNQWLELDWENEFMTGSWVQKKIDNNAGFLQYLNGMIICKKQHLLNAGGYNEIFTDYGWEDSDLYGRLIDNLGLKRIFLPIIEQDHFIPIYHNPHTDYERNKNQINKNIHESLQKNMQKTSYKSPL